VTFSFERREPPAPWGNAQPKFECLTTDEEGRFYIVYESDSGEKIRVPLGPAQWRT